MALLFNWNASIHLRYCFEVWTCYALFKHLRYCSGLLCSVEAASYKLLNNSLQPGIKAWSHLKCNSHLKYKQHTWGDNPKKSLKNPFQLWSYLVEICNLKFKLISRPKWQIILKNRMLWLEWDLFCKVDALQSWNIKIYEKLRKLAFWDTKGTNWDKSLCYGLQGICK